MRSTASDVVKGHSLEAHMYTYDCHQAIRIEHVRECVVIKYTVVGTVRVADVRNGICHRAG